VGGERDERAVMAFVELSALPTKDSASHRNRHSMSTGRIVKRGRGWLAKKHLPIRTEPKQRSNWILLFIGESSVS